MPTKKVLRTIRPADVATIRAAWPNRKTRRVNPVAELAYAVLQSNASALYDIKKRTLELAEQKQVAHQAVTKYSATATEWLQEFGCLRRMVNWLHSNTGALLAGMTAAEACEALGQDPAVMCNFIASVLDDDYYRMVRNMKPFMCPVCGHHHRAAAIDTHELLASGLATN